jgi:acetolactate synthase-1/2/3 large subunit
MKMKVSDYIAKRLVEHGVKHVFLVTGGGAMHLNDSFGKEPGLDYICNHHEQASAMAAEGYSRVLNKLAVVNVTTGPGSTNTLTGVIGQWLDSIPVLYISGQVKQETCVNSYDIPGLRQIGDQEINIIDIVKSVTKYAKTITNPLEVKKVIDKAIYIATSGRPGPVWVNVPLDIQGAIIETDDLIEYNKLEDEFLIDKDSIKNSVKQVIELLKESKRPVLVAGHGITISGGKKEFRKLVDKLKIPVVTTFNGFDILSSNNPCYIGRVGTIGDRAGNFAVQNSDLYISIGSRNNIRQISYNWKAYAREAKKIIVDIDKSELLKPTISPDLPIQSDAKVFINLLLEELKNESLKDFSEWLNWCQKRKGKYIVINEHPKKSEEGLNPYHFIDILTKNFTDNQISVAANGTACVALFQAGNVKKAQRIFWNSGCASMGHALPASIGACIANDKKEVICIEGDGSIQMNIQELATVSYYRLPIKIFLLNNDGYISIKQTQDNYFNGRRYGCDRNSGLGFPNYKILAEAYGIKYFSITKDDGLEEKIELVMKEKGPIICEVILDPNYQFMPKLSSEKRPDGTIISKPLEDMFPFLNRDEFKENLLIKELNL